ncbi:hypothetical protein L596_010154 [Steinernema carpocapsae]|uniref:Uncharacterized protein n=1 Tax=Steinernema carpocapsae TaxID=34508 RepID=A0A4U5PHI5_STECR|nr:hypothetical protein L596_010154 [Steinernema carpocapsae]
MTLCFSWTLTALVILGTAAENASKPTIRLNTAVGNEFEFCPMNGLANNYFHTVTCYGFVRVKMYGKDNDTLDQEIVKLLEDHKIDKSKRELCEIRSFYFNSTAWIFFKMPDFSRVNSPIEKNVSYWIVDLLGKKGFIPFPPKENWTFIGKGYKTFEFKKLSDHVIKNETAICNPYNWYFRHQNMDFRVSTGGRVSLNDTFNARRSTQKDCHPNFAQFQQNDPITERYNTSTGPNTIYSSGYHKRALIKTQVYSEHQLHAARIGKNMSDYHFIFEYRNLTELEKYFDKKMDRDKLSHHYCYLRPIRHDLGELPHGFMLPEVEGMKLWDPSIITTTTVSMTLEASTEAENLTFTPQIKAEVIVEEIEENPGSSDAEVYVIVTVAATFVLAIVALGVLGIWAFRR